MEVLLLRYRNVQFKLDESDQRIHRCQYVKLGEHIVEGKEHFSLIVNTLKQWKHFITNTEFSNTRRFLYISLGN